MKPRKENFAKPDIAKALLAGAGIELESAGIHELKGIAEPDELYRVVMAS
jgi:hypothetical protein